MNFAIKLLHVIAVVPLLFFLCLSFGHAQESQFDKLLNESFSESGPGATALVAKKDNIIYKKAFGQANLELGVPIQPDNVFEVGSITK